ncbi:uncharacterized protein LOC114964270 [Acropora millepora]|uniref:uncharacterized protein LOC114964270 n=1 Tax=Acropora millepora TaxID=45264 RepID=UPI001CF18295|nr:uncharacterized protein LOC114964270 [Acropora millepora]
MGSGKAPIEEPEWFTILNPIFSDTMGDMDAASSPSDVLSPTASSSSDEEGDNDRPNTSNNQDRAEESCDSADEISSETSSSSCGTKRKQKKPQLQVKPCLKKRARSQTQAMQEMAKTFSALGEQQQKRSENMVEAEKEIQAEFFRFQREQAELNRQHELKMVEIIMKFTNPQPPVHYGSTQVAQQVQQPTSHSYYNHTTTFNQLPQVTLIHPKWHPLRQTISLVLINTNNQHQEIAGTNIVKNCCAFIFKFASTVTSEVDVWSCVTMANSI